MGVSSPPDARNLTTKQELYLEVFSRTGHHGKSCEAAEVDPRTPRRWWTEGESGYSEEFARQLEVARDGARQYLRDVAIEQATDAEKPNHVVLLRLLEAYDPAFRQKREIQHSGSVDHTVRRVVFADEPAVEPDTTKGADQ